MVACREFDARTLIVSLIEVSVRLETFVFGLLLLFRSLQGVVLETEVSFTGFASLSCTAPSSWASPTSSSASLSILSRCSS